MPNKSPIQLILGLFPGTMATGSIKVSCSPPSSAPVKNGWCYSSTFPYAFMACTGKTFNFTTIS